MKKPARKDPAMLFYPADFLTGAALMTMKERGQYITLLCLQQQRGHLTKKDMIRAVGKLSDELMSKFEQDEEGKYYNVRAEYEINRRKTHCEQQSKNVSNRWNKSGTAVGNQNGNTTVYTAVLPLETPTPIERENTTESLVLEGVTEDRGSGGKEPLGDPAFASVMSLYMDRVQAVPSATCIELLRDYTEALSAEVVRHAIEKALDDNKASWSYIQGILRRYKQDGLTTLTAVQKAEAQFQADRDRSRQARAQWSRRKSGTQPSGTSEIGKRAIAQLLAETEGVDD